MTEAIKSPYAIIKDGEGVPSIELLAYPPIGYKYCPDTILSDVIIEVNFKTHTLDIYGRKWYATYLSKPIELATVKAIGEEPIAHFIQSGCRTIWDFFRRKHTQYLSDWYYYVRALPKEKTFTTAQNLAMVEKQMKGDFHATMSSWFLIL